MKIYINWQSLSLADVDQQETNRRQQLDFKTLWGLTLRQTIHRGEVVKAILHVFFGRDVVLLTDNIIKKWRETEMMWLQEVALCQTCEDKDSKRN